MPAALSKAMAREVEEALSNARNRFEREMEQELKEMERRHRPRHGTDYQWMVFDYSLVFIWCIIIYDSMYNIYIYIYIHI